MEEYGRLEGGGGEGGGGLFQHWHAVKRERVSELQRAKKKRLNFCVQIVNFFVFLLSSYSR